MKKILSLLLIICMMLSVLISCKKETDNPDETENAVATFDETEYKKDILPEENINPRDIVVDYMYKMASIEWKASQTIDLSSVKDTLIYRKGQKYKGIIYCTVNNMNNYDAFAAEIEDGVYTGSSDKATVVGNHCSSAIRVAYDLISNDVTFGSTVDMVPSRNKGTKIVGDYTFNALDKTTDEIIARNTAEKMYECYALLKKGDNILTCWGSTGHTRMIVDVVVERDSSGKINPGRSYVVTVEQTSSFERDKETKLTTSWFIDHKYKFSELFNEKYIPLTIDALEGNIPSITGQALTGSANITKGKLNGIIYSKGVPIQSVDVKVITPEGELVIDKNFVNTEKVKNQFLCQTITIDELTTLPAGRYQYSLIVNTVYGQVIANSFYFTVE